MADEWMWIAYKDRMMVCKTYIEVVGHIRKINGDQIKYM